MRTAIGIFMIVLYISVGLGFGMAFTDWQRKHCPPPEIHASAMPIMIVTWPVLILAGFVAIALGDTGSGNCGKSD